MASTITVPINPDVLKELTCAVDLHRMYGAPNRFNNVPDMAAYILSSVAEGLRRPGMERQMLELMGLVPEPVVH